MYTNRIKHLEEMHRILDKKIDGLEKTGAFSDNGLNELKKQRLRLKDELSILKHKHQTDSDSK